MKLSWMFIYHLVLALWIGGIAVFTFIITPTIFRSFGKDRAGEIVGRLFPGYYLYNLVIAAVALVMFFLVAGDQTTTMARLSLFLVTIALFVNAYIVFKLHPDTVRVKQQIISFERESPVSPARKQFSSLHAASASLNLLLLIDGIVLLLISPALKK